MTEPSAERVLAGRYELGSVLGKGGMGVVHAARDRLLDRKVAVKLLFPMADPVMQERFLREAKTTARLRHPGIVEVFDFGETPDHELYLVMELLEGRTLGELLREGPLEPREAIRIARAVAGALATAHAEGVVHRDLKPGNVLVVPRAGAAPTVKLLDFGIAKSLGPERSLTAEGHMIGTLDYMAPEQILGEPIDARTDVYALGCLLCATLTAQPPFPGASAAQVIHKQLSEQPEPPSSREPGIAPALDAVVARCLAKKKEERYPDMAALDLALASALEGASPQAKVAPVPGAPPPAVAPVAVPDLDLRREAPTSRAPRSVPRAAPSAAAPAPAPAPAPREPLALEVDAEDDPVAAIEVAAPSSPVASLPTLAERRVCTTCGAALARYATSCVACGGTTSAVVRVEDALLAPPARELARRGDDAEPWATLTRVPTSVHGAVLGLSLLGILMGILSGHAWLAAPLVVALAGASLGLFAHSRD